MIAVFSGIIGLNILLYAMFGAGGWAFGSRYLIPSYAIMAILISLVLTKWKKKSILLLLFFLIAGYSIAVNTLGAITSNRNPPKVEAIPLSQLSGREEKYTYERNLEFLTENKSKSFVFQTYASKYLTAWQYYLIIASSIIGVTASLLVYLHFSAKGQKI